MHGYYVLVYHMLYTMLSMDMYHYREDPHIGYFRGVPPILLHPSFYHTLCNMLLLAKRAH